MIAFSHYLQRISRHQQDLEVFAHGLFRGLDGLHRLIGSLQLRIRAGQFSMNHWIVNDLQRTVQRVHRLLVVSQAKLDFGEREIGPDFIRFEL